MENCLMDSHRNWIKIVGFTLVNLINGQNSREGDFTKEYKNIFPFPDISVEPQSSIFSVIFSSKTFCEHSFCLPAVNET